MSQGDEVPLSERRAVSERRRYNRRTAPEPGSPPYYEIFDRIASALESIASSLGGNAQPYPPTPVRPRESSESDASSS